MARASPIRRTAARARRDRTRSAWPAAVVLALLGAACAPAEPGEQGVSEVDFDAITVLTEPVVLPLLGERLPIVEVDVAGAGPARFLVDSAMEVTLLDAGFAARAGLPQQPFAIDFQVQAANGRLQRLERVALLERIVLGGSSGASATASALSLRAPLADLAALDVGVDGILGQDVLGDWALLFDAGARQLVLLPPDDLLRRLAAFLPAGMACESIALHGEDRIPRFLLTFAEPALEIELHVDTGATRTCLPLAVLEALGAGPGTPTETTTLAGAEARHAWNVDDFPLGTQRVPVQVEGTSTSWGLLGYDALSQRRFVLDGPGRRLLVAVEGAGR